MLCDVPVLPGFLCYCSALTVLCRALPPSLRTSCVAGSERRRREGGQMAKALTVVIYVCVCACVHRSRTSTLSCRVVRSLPRAPVRPMTAMTMTTCPGGRGCSAHRAKQHRAAPHTHTDPPAGDAGCSTEAHTHGDACPLGSPGAQTARCHAHMYAEGAPYDGGSHSAGGMGYTHDYLTGQQPCTGSTAQETSAPDVPDGVFGPSPCSQRRTAHCEPWWETMAARLAHMRRTRDASSHMQPSKL